MSYVPINFGQIYTYLMASGIKKKKKWRKNNTYVFLIKFIINKIHVQNQNQVFNKIAYKLI